MVITCILLDFHVALKKKVHKTFCAFVLVVNDVEFNIDIGR